MIRRIIELEKWRLTKKLFKISSSRFEISGGPLGVKFRIQGHLGVGKAEKHPLVQNCPKADATVNKIFKENDISFGHQSIAVANIEREESEQE